MYIKGLNFINRMNHINERIRQEINRKRLINSDFSIISSNCNGGVMLHDLGLKFDTPTVNLMFYPDDYIKLCYNTKYYFSQKLEFISNTDRNYPIAKLDDIFVHFLHYHSIEEAEQKWNDRVSRVHYDNLFYLFTDRDGCTEQHLREFDDLPYNNKIVFTAKKYKGIKSAIYLKAFKGKKQVGVLSNFKNFTFGKKYYDDFNYVKWLNKGVNKENMRSRMTH